MPLPDASRLASISAASWRALAERLRSIGVTKARAAEIGDVTAALREFMRPPMRRWHLRRTNDRAAVAMRLLMFGDPVGAREAEDALGRELLLVLARGGFVVDAAAGELVSPFLLNFVGDLFIVCDELSAGGDAVMGAGETTGDLCNAAYPLRDVRDVLDVGCGAGTAALLFARRARLAVGVDVNPRAILLSRVNAAINGIENVEFLEGDLFAPVEGRTFDRIVSQPPFVARYDGGRSTTYLDGGSRGDEIALRLLRETPPYLALSGRAVVLVEWPVTDDAPIEARIREAVPDRRVSVLLLEGPGRSLDQYCTLYAAREHPDHGEAFARAATERREHLDRLGIRDLRVGVAVLENRPSGEAWTWSLAIRALTQAELNAPRIDRLIAVRDLLDAGTGALLAATLRLPESTSFVDERDAPGADPPSHVLVRFHPGALIEPVRVNAASLFLLSTIHAAPDVRSAVERVAAAWSAPAGLAEEKVLAAVRSALLGGILEVVGKT